MSTSVRSIPIERIDMDGHQWGVTQLHLGTEAFLMISIFGKETWVSPVVMNECDACGERLRFTVSGGPDFDVSVTLPCQFGASVDTVSTVTFPSGRVIVDDDLRPVFDGSELPGQRSYNSLAGQRDVIVAYAAQGCAYGPVGNTDPRVYRQPSGSLVISDMGYDGDVPDGWTELAQVCTDLWAYSMADYDLWLARGGEPVEGENQYGTRSVIEVEPGAYRFTHYSGSCDDAQVFGRLERHADPHVAL